MPRAKTESKKTPAKTKSTANKTAKTTNEKNRPAIDPNIRILLQGNSPKLTPRGRGELLYNLGVNDTTDQIFLRISGNTLGSGTFSHEWLDIAKIKECLDEITEPQFRTIELQKIFGKKSNNNHGYLGAILKTEGVLTADPDKLTLLSLGSWDQLTQRVNSLKEQDINMPDLIAETIQEREAKKAKLLADMQAAKAAKKAKKSEEPATE